MATRHLAWASGNCRGVAFSAPLDTLAANKICRVVCKAPPREGKCTAKATLWSYNAAPVYDAFAREEALRVVHLWDPPPVVLRYLRTGNESIRAAAEGAGWAAWAARATVGAAAGDAARATAWAAWAAGDAARTWAAWAAWAARATARGGAEAAAKATAWAATGATTIAASQRRQNRRLARLLTAGRALYGPRQL